MAKPKQELWGVVVLHKDGKTWTGHGPLNKDIDKLCVPDVGVHYLAYEFFCVEVEDVHG